jgi:hypothetical protein
MDSNSERRKRKREEGIRRIYTVSSKAASNEPLS